MLGANLGSLLNGDVSVMLSIKVFSTSFIELILAGERLEERRTETAEKLKEARDSSKDRSTKGDNW